MLLSELSAPTRRLALFGLAKNTGKTETLGALLRELQVAGQIVGVTSIGRDGEEFDAINHGIQKPRIHLSAHNVVATTDMLLRSSGLAHEVLQRTSYRTPLGQVVVSRLRESGTIEVAGPSAIEDVRQVCDTMLHFGVDRVLVDGAINRKAAASPAVADGVVIATGAVLHTELEEVVRSTKAAVDLFRLPVVEEPRLSAVAESLAGSALLTEDFEAISIGAQLALASSPEGIVALLGRHRRARHIVIKGALCESFVEHVRLAAAGRPFTFVVGDSTKVFLTRRSVDWYRKQSIRIEALRRTRLEAITVNPVSPKSHRFDSRRFRQLLGAAIPDVHIFDVMDRQSYAAG